MADYTENALSVLQQRGYRITKPRRLVVDILNRNDTALSAYEIRDQLESAGEHIDIVSVYRILECLEENHLIHRVLMTGKVRKCQLEDEERCDRHQADHCHHLLICRICGAIQEIHCVGMDNIVEQVSQVPGFQVEKHQLEFLGRCEGCLQTAQVPEPQRL